MKELKLKVYLDPRKAAELGLSKAGTAEYPLRGVLPLLSDDERKMLSSYHLDSEGVLSRRPFNLELSAELSDESVADALKADYSSYAEEQREFDEQVDALLSLPDEDWIYYTKTEFPIQRPRIKDKYNWRGLADYSILDDPRVKARKYHVEDTLFAELRAKYEEGIAPYEEKEKADKEAKRAAEVAEEKAKEKEAAENREHLRKWAAEQKGLPSNVSRAASEGYDVHQKVTSYLHKAIKNVVQDIVGPMGGTIHDGQDFQESTRVPSELDYEIHDALVEFSEKIALAAKIDCEVKIGPFNQIDTTDENDWHDAVEVKVLTKWLGDIGTYVITEPIDEADE
jgi:hypothetical protein